MNKFYGQIQGPFSANEDVFALIQAEMDGDQDVITSIGVQSDYGSVVNLNGNSFEINRPEEIQFEEVEITSIYFENDVDENTIIDFVYE